MSMEETHSNGIADVLWAWAAYIVSSVLLVSALYICPYILSGATRNLFYFFVGGAIWILEILDEFADNQFNN